MIKTLHKVDIKGMYFNIIKVIYDKPTATIILSSERMKAFPLRLGQDKVPTLTTHIQRSTGSPSQSN